MFLSSILYNNAGFALLCDPLWKAWCLSCQSQNLGCQLICSKQKESQSTVQQLGDQDKNQAPVSLRNSRKKRITCSNQVLHSTMRHQPEILSNIQYLCRHSVSAQSWNRNQSVSLFLHREGHQASIYSPSVGYKSLCKPCRVYINVIYTAATQQPFASGVRKMMAWTCTVHRFHTESLFIQYTLIHSLTLSCR